MPIVITHINKSSSKSSIMFKYVRVLGSKSLRTIDIDNQASQLEVLI